MALPYRRSPQFQGQGKGEADDSFQQELGKRIIDAADRNTRNNDQRSRTSMFRPGCYQPERQLLDGFRTR